MQTFAEKKGLKLESQKPEKPLPKVMADPFKIQDAEGSVIDLYISKKIIDLHHGRIWAESDGEGRGSRFRVGLKLVE